MRHSFEEVDDVALQTRHHRLRLRVTHTTVVFDDHRLSLDIDESEEDKALIVETFLRQSLHGRTDDAVFHFLHPLLRGEGDGRDAAHATGVESGVVLADALIVFSLRQDLIMLAIGQHKDGALDAGEELLDDDLCRGIAEHAVEHLPKLLLGSLEGRHNEHALAGSQPVGLQHIRRLERLQELTALFHRRAVEGLIGCRGDMVPFHEPFCKILTAFELGASLRRTDDRDVLRARVCLESVVDTLHQRILGTDDHHVDDVPDDEVFLSLEVIHPDGDILPHRCRARIARGDIEFFALRALRDLPCQRMLASATA